MNGAKQKEIVSHCHKFVTVTGGPPPASVEVAIKHYRRKRLVSLLSSSAQSAFMRTVPCMSGPPAKFIPRSSSALSYETRYLGKRGTLHRHCRGKVLLSKSWCPGCVFNSQP
jgi:hypothetical protein